MNEKQPTAKKVLVAEDIPSIAALMASLLKNRGYLVETASDGQECLDKARGFQPDLMILDIMMPKVHGIEVLRQIKADPTTSRAGVLMCTAKTYKPDHDQVRQLGAFDVLIKPFEKEEFVRVVDRFFTGANEKPHNHPKPGSGETYLPSVPKDVACFRLWGTRGSIPVSGPKHVRHGGNTTCFEVALGEESLIIDAGTGIRELGMRLAKQGPRKLRLLITHTHWDHIQGFPFFAPAYIPGFELEIYGASGFKKDLASVFRGQLDSDYFPVQFEDMRAKIEFLPLPPQPMRIGNFSITWQYTHHPSATLSYKVEVNGKSVAFVSDNEFLFGYMGAPHGLTMNSEPVTLHRPLVEFLMDVDVLVGEAQYTNDEYQTKVGWGHSSVSNACALAKLARVKRWIVTHHDPIHEDDFLDNKLNLTKQVLRSMDYPIEVTHAHDAITDYP